jgi:hypothetical protein
MSTATVTDAAWVANPFVYRNNRICAMVKGRMVRAGVPTPAPHKQADGSFREDDDAYKGGDLIGFEQVTITEDMVGKTVAVFKNIEIKGSGDTMKPGQIRWHNFMLDHGARSEIWIEQSDGTIDIVKEKMDED